MLIFGWFCGEDCLIFLFVYISMCRDLTEWKVRLSSDSHSNQFHDLLKFRHCCWCSMFESNVDKLPNVEAHLQAPHVNFCIIRSFEYFCVFCFVWSRSTSTNLISDDMWVTCRRVTHVERFIHRNGRNPLLPHTTVNYAISCDRNHTCKM